MATTIDEFIAGFPAKQQKLMQQLRKTILKAAPNAGETINYGIPTFTLHGNLVHFSAYEHHIGFYPGAAGIANLRQRPPVFEIERLPYLPSM